MVEGCLHTKWYVYLNDWYVFNIWKIGTSIEILNDFTCVFTSMIVWKWMRNNRNSEIGTPKSVERIRCIDPKSTWYVGESRYSFKSTIYIYRWFHIWYLYMTLYMYISMFIYVDPDPGGNDPIWLSFFKPKNQWLIPWCSGYNIKVQQIITWKEH